MEGEDEEEDLLVFAIISDNDELSENEEISHRPTPKHQHVTRHRALRLHSIPPTDRLRFAFTTFLLIICSTSLLIILPLYTNSVNIKGDAYTAILFLSTASTCIFFALACIFGLFYGVRPLLSLPFAITKMARVSLIFALSVILIVYSLDRNRVMCHLQDPIKGIVLVLSLVCYFCFCRQRLGLDRIVCFSAMVVGLFVSVDYGLCDEFRCRGNERSGDRWSTEGHVLWTVAYLAGLALWTLHYAMLEEMVTADKSCWYRGTSLVATVSRQVDLGGRLESPPVASPVVASTGLLVAQLALWLHLVTLVLTISLSWTDTIQTTRSTASDGLWNVTGSSLSCLLGSGPDCRCSALLAWATLGAYVGFTLAALHLLVASRSSVFTVATASVALPLGALWWSFFAIDSAGVSILWSPAVTGELVCSLLGLPVVVGALVVLLNKYFYEPSGPQGPSYVLRA